MLFWRFISVVFLVIGLGLFIQSLIMQNITFFYFALASYGMGSMIWLTIQKLYIEPFTPPKKSPYDYSQLDSCDIILLFDIVLSLPKIIFTFLIRTIYH